MLYIWLFADGKIQRLKPQYISQLKSYGITFWEKGYPAENIFCRIRGLCRDEDVTLSFSNQEYEDHKAFLYNLKKSINHHSRSGTTKTLGNPSPSVCEKCDYNHNCSPLQEFLMMHNNDFNSIVLITQINVEFDDMNSKINIRTNGGTQSIYHIPKSDYTNIREAIFHEKQILVTNLFNILNSNFKKWTSITTYSCID